MTWTLMMLLVAFGLAISAFLGWRKERRAEAARSHEPHLAAAPETEDGTSRVARRDYPAHPRQTGAGAR